MALGRCWPPDLPVSETYYQGDSEMKKIIVVVLVVAIVGIGVAVVNNHTDAKKEEAAAQLAKERAAKQIQGVQSLYDAMGK